MNVELKKKVVVKEDKTYTNLYLKIGETLVPIIVANVKDKGGNVLNKHDYSLVKTIAEKIN